MCSQLPTASPGRFMQRRQFESSVKMLFFTFHHLYYNFVFRLLASLLVELGEYDISGPTEYMSTKEKAVSKDDIIPSKKVLIFSTIVRC
jgi:hypothetical protein